MRDIKFRAWDKKNKQMMSEVCVSVQNSDWNVYLNDYLSSPINGDDGKPLILMQFTGLLDKNGKEIYEGDVAEWRNRKYTIVWEKDGFGAKEDKNTVIALRAFIDMDVLQVIGNIYENPSLINE